MQKRWTQQKKPFVESKTLSLTEITTTKRNNNDRHGKDLEKFHVLTVVLKITFNSLPKDKNLDQSNLKAFADNKRDMTKKLKFVLSKVKKETLWEKEKMLVTSIFSFLHNVFKGLLFQGC